jgi:hypothetical protein
VSVFINKLPRDFIVGVMNDGNPVYFNRQLELLTAWPGAKVWRRTTGKISILSTKYKWFCEAATVCVIVISHCFVTPTMKMEQEQRSSFCGL